MFFLFEFVGRLCGSLKPDCATLRQAIPSPQSFSTLSSVNPARPYWVPTHKVPVPLWPQVLLISKGYRFHFPQTKVEGDQEGDERGVGPITSSWGYSSANHLQPRCSDRKERFFCSLSVRGAAHTPTADPHQSKAKSYRTNLMRFIVFCSNLPRSSAITVQTHSN